MSRILGAVHFDRPFHNLMENADYWNYVCVLNCRTSHQWNHQYPKIGESWRENWENIRTIFSYPAEIRHAIYTTNAIESLNSVIRHSTKKRKIFSSDDSVKKVIYLATSNAAKKWIMPIQNWRLAMNWFTIQFDDRLKDHL